MENQLSFSKLRTYATCPKQYDYKYNQKLPSFQTEGMKYGSDLHQTISDELLEKKPVYTVFPSEKLSEAERMVNNALQYVGDRTLVGSEQKFGMTEEFEEATYEDGLFKGILDSIIYDPDDGMEIIDFKTNFAGYPKEQLLFYALLLNANFKVLPDKLTYFSLRLNQAVSYTVSAKELKELENFKKRLLKQKHEIEAAKEFKEKPGEHCSFCSYIHKCPAAKMLEIPMITDDKSALQQLKLAEAHAALSSSLKKTAQAFVKKSGESIVDGDKVFGPVTSQAISIKNEDELLRKLQAEGYNSETLRKLDTKALKTIPGLTEKFGEELKITTRTTYKWSKKLTKKEVEKYDTCNSHSNRKTA